MDGPRIPPTLCKYLAVAPILSGTTFDKGKNPYQDFALLFTARNAVMHFKAVDQAGPQEGETMNFTIPKFVKQL
jgi:hypothetical protein